ncbi:MAG: hypothetical protein N3G48_03745 [Sulfolobales archaeon]|nr:hypothetical protein [Sulfolobales archaeon]
MRFHELLGLIIIVISYNLHLYLLGLPHQVLTFITLSTIYAISLSITSALIYKDLRNGLAVTYLFLGFTFIYAYGSFPGVLYRFYLGPYLMSLIPIAASLVAAALTLRSAREISFTYVPTVLSLPTTLLDPWGVAPVGAMLSHTLFLKKASDSLRFVAASLLIYLPYILLPVILVNLEFLPQINICNVFYGASGHELNLAKAFAVVLAFIMVFDVLYHRVIKHYLPKVTEPTHLIRNSLIFYVISLAAVLPVPTLINSLIPTKSQIPYYSVLYASIPSLLMSLIASYWTLMTDLESFKSNNIKALRRIQEELNSCKSVLSELITNTLLGVKVSKYSETLEELSKQLNVVEKHLSKPALSLSHMKSTAETLDNVWGELINVKKQVIYTYKSTLKDISEIYDDLVSLGGFKDAELDELIRLMESVNRFEDIPSVSIGLSRALRRICESYLKLINDLVSNLSEVVEIEASVDTSLKCSEDVLLLNTSKAYRQAVKGVLSSEALTLSLANLTRNASQTTQLLSKLIDEYRGTLHQELLRSAEAIASDVKAIQQMEVSSCKDVQDLKTRCRELRDDLHEFVELVREELESEEKLIKSASDKLGLEFSDLVPIPPTAITKSLKDFLSFKNASTCSELMKWLNTRGVGLIYEHLFYIEMYVKVLRSTAYIQLLTNYFDNMLQRGDVVLDDLPLSKDTLKWFLNVYRSIRRDVVVEGNVLRSVGGKEVGPN